LFNGEKSLERKPWQEVELWRELKLWLEKFWLELKR
jgi:hypothetical protein